MAAEHTVSMRLGADTREFQAEMQKSAKVTDELAGVGDKVGAKLDGMFAGVVDSAGRTEDGIRSLDDRLSTLTAGERDLVIRASIDQAEQGIRQLDRMLGDPTLTDPEIRVLMDRRNEATRAIEDLREQIDDLGPAAAEAGAEIERGLDVGALTGAAASWGVSERIDDAVVSSGRLRAQLGLTADEAREFDQVARQVYRNNFGESMGHAAQATGMVHQSLGLVGAELQDTTQMVFSVSDAFEHVGADLPILLEDVRALRANFPGTTEAQALDMIAWGFQNGAGNAGDLQDTLQEYPGDFARIGLNASDMLGILNTGMEHGARNTDIVADAVREMGIRISTAGDTGQEAIRRLFPRDEAERLIADFARGGETGRQAFFDILDGLTAVQDPTDRYNLAVELMGTRGEELANQLPGMREELLALRDSTIDAGGAAESTGAQYSGFRNTLSEMLRTIETSAIGRLGDMGVGILDVGANAGIALLGLTGLRDILPGFRSRIGSVASSARDGARSLRTFQGAVRGLSFAGAAAGLFLLTERLNENRAAASRYAQEIAGGFSDPERQLRNVRAELEELEHVAGRGVRVDWVPGVSIFSSGEAKEAQDRIDALNDLAADLELQIQLNADAAGEADDALGGMGESAGAAESSMAGLGGAAAETTSVYEQMQAVVEANEQALSDWEAQVNDVIEGAFRSENALADWEAGWDSLTEQVRTHGATLDISTEQGRQNRQMIQDLVRAGGERIQALADEGASTEELTYARDLMILGLEEELRQLGFNEEETRHYIEALADVPTRVPTRLDVDKYAADQALFFYKLALGGIPRHITTTLAVDAGPASAAIGSVLGQMANLRAAGGRASGGPVGAGEMWWVGEEGPELLFMPRDGYVYNATESAQMAAGGASPAGAGGYQVVQHFTIYASSIEERELGIRVRDSAAEGARQGIGGL